MVVKVDYVWWGIASRVNDTIILNKHLKTDDRFKKYAEEVLEHELRHSSGYTLNDVKMDMLEGDFFKNIWFCLNHPAGFLQFIPVSFYKKNILIDFNLILNYVLGLILLTIFMLLIKGL